MDIVEKIVKEKLGNSLLGTTPDGLLITINITSFCIKNLNHEDIILKIIENREISDNFLVES